MKTKIKKIRPAVISRNTYQYLDEYRGFRHVVRNVYTFNLSRDRMEPLVKDIDTLFQTVKKELGNFITYIEEMVDEDEHKE